MIGQAKNTVMYIVLVSPNCNAETAGLSGNAFDKLNCKSELELNEWFFIAALTHIHITEFNESSWLTVCESVCVPKEAEDEDGTFFYVSDILAIAYIILFKNNIYMLKVDITVCFKINFHSIYISSFLSYIFRSQSALTFSFSHLLILHAIYCDIL